MKGGYLRAAVGAAASMLGVLWVCGQAGAQPSDAPDAPLALHWVRGPDAEGCIDAKRLAQSLEQRLGRPVFGPAAAAEMWLEGSVRRRPEGGYVAALRWVDAQGAEAGRRELESAHDDCRELSEAVALVLAVMVDPEAALREPAPEATPDPAPAPPAAAGEVAGAEPDATPTPAPAEEGPPATHHGLGALARINVGTLPSVQVGGGIYYVHAFARRIQMRLEALVFDEQAVGVAVGEQTGQVLLRQVAFAASVCPSLLERRGAQLALCAGVLAGVLLQTYRGLTTDAGAPLGMFSGFAGVRAGWGDARVRVDLGAALSVAAIRQRLYVDDARTGLREDVFLQGALALELDASVGVRF